MPVLIFIFGLVLSILIHEAGHFYFARRSGMRVPEFFIGFGPRLWSFRRGETEYGVRAIPAGGYVKIIGMRLESRKVVAQRPMADDLADIDQDQQPATAATLMTERGIPDDVAAAIIAAAADDRSWNDAVLAVLGSPEHPRELAWRLLYGDEGRRYRERTRRERARTILGGPATHFVQAAAILLIANVGFGSLALTGSISQVRDDSPADRAGIETGDVLVGVDGAAAETLDIVERLLNTDDDISVTYLDVSADTEVTVDLPPGSTELDVRGMVPATSQSPNVTVAAVRNAFFGPDGLIPVVAASVQILPGVFTTDTLVALADAVQGGERDAETSLMSVVGITRVAGDVGGLYGPYFLLLLLAFTNIALGFFNLLPIPPLDGGHFVVIVIESIVNRARGITGASPDWILPDWALRIVVTMATVLVIAGSLVIVGLDIANPVSL